MRHIAMLTMHSCPVGLPGERDVGGMNVYVTNVAGELAKFGYTVDLYTRCHDLDDQLVTDLVPGVRVIHLPAGPIDGPKEDLHQYVSAFTHGVEAFRRERDISYDLVHSHYWLSAISASELSAQWEVPHVTMFHTTALTKMLARFGEWEPEHRVDGERKVIESADAVIVSTDEERTALARLYGADPAKIQVISAGVDTALFKPTAKADARRSLGFAEENIVLSVGRVEPLKGLDILLMAMATLDDRSSTRVIIVGGDPETDRETVRLLAISNTLGLGELVTFTGAVPQERLNVYYNAADIFVLPSYYESFGLVALEAMACGVPVIASRVGGPKSFVKGGVTGYLIDWRCPEPFAQKLDILLHNPALRESMGRAARSHAETMGWENVGRRTMDVYESVTADARLDVLTPV
jgi:D-inositol-3-phosphate glycosyltransferase